MRHFYYISNSVVLFYSCCISTFFASKSISICTTLCSTPFWAVFTVGGPSIQNEKKKERYKKWLPVAHNSYLILSPPLR